MEEVDMPPRPSDKAPNVNDYIEIWWAGDRVYYRGTVISFNEDTGKHCVLYDDGESGSYEMKKETWRMLRSASAGASARSGGARSVATGQSVGGTARAHSGKHITHGMHSGRSKHSSARKPEETSMRRHANEGGTSSLTPVETRVPAGVVEAAGASSTATSNHSHPNDVDPNSTDIDRLDIGMPTLPPPARKIKQPSTHENTRIKKNNQEDTTLADIGSAGKLDLQNIGRNNETRETSRDENDRGGDRHSRRNSVTSVDENLSSARVSDDVNAKHGSNSELAGQKRPREEEVPVTATTHAPPVTSSLEGKEVSRERQTTATLPTSDDVRNTPGLQAQQEATEGPPSVPSQSNVPLLPLNHVMTAVVQSTMMLLDERLKPIGDRLEGIRGELRIDSPDSIFKLISRQHAQHLDDMQEMRREVRSLKAEHRNVITEAVAVKEDAFKQYFDSSLKRAVGSIAAACRSAITASTATTAPAAAAARTDMLHLSSQAKAPASISPGNITDGPTTHPLPDISMHRHIARLRDDRPIVPDGNWGNDSINLSVPTPTYGATNNMQPNIPHISPHLQNSVPAGPIEGDVISSMKRRCLEIVARQVSMWLLQTPHECSDTARRNQWVHTTANLCLRSVADTLVQFKSYEIASQSLLSTLGKDTLELAWFLFAAVPENLRRARRNYTGWVPPVTEEEWSLEELLLKELSDRYHMELSNYQVQGTENEIDMAVRVASAAARSDAVYGSTTGR